MAFNASTLADITDVCVCVCACTPEFRPQSLFIYANLSPPQYMFIYELDLFPEINSTTDKKKTLK